MLKQRKINKWTWAYWFLFIVLATHILLLYLFEHTYQ